MKKLAVWAAGLLLSCVCLLGGCSDKGAEEKVKDLEFTVVGQNEIPKELMDMIEQKKAEEFRLTYTSGEDLYIAVGYGEQQTGGFSISVPEFYLTENSMVIKTELQGPEQGSQQAASPSYPFIVIKTKFIEEPVVFQ
ncbi:MAG: protease complex subunit PrcB family protein [Clostridium sp.]|nr:protease complex subunit PrcB family protein [Clostridium sp.]MBS6914987.1 protease complex subunit PrcB family protein [Clostridium sp.]